MLFTQTISPLTFKTWLWKDRENRTLLIFAALATVVSFAWLKILYPFPNFMPPDSNSYLEAAFSNQFINLWAIGYSKFVRLVSSFTNSHFALVLLQYLMLQASVLYFLFSIRYLFSPGKWGFRVLLAISILNPLLVHIANFVSSDALFTTLSIVWLTQLLWITYQPIQKILYWHALIILLAFIVRYTALYYPFISMAVILLSPTNKKRKLISVGLIVLLIGSFIGRSVYEYKIKTNTLQYSAFAGWQIASNALYGYAHADQMPLEKVPSKFKALHAIVNKHYETLKPYPVFLRPDYEVAVYYLWDFNSPLRVYMNKLHPMPNASEYFYRWSSFGPLYASYGQFLIKHYPKEFIQYYIWPNFLKYYAPPTKFMGAYNLEQLTVEPAVVNWFGWKNNKLPSYFKNRKIKITEVFPILFAAINIVFVLGFLSFIVLGGFRNCKYVYKRLLYMVVAIWFINMIFSVFAAPIELRYQIFPMVFTLGFSWLLMTFTVLKTRQSEEKHVVENSLAEAAL